VEISSWRVPSNAPVAVARHVIVAAFTAPASQTMETLADTMPRGSTLEIICPEPVQRPKGKFHVKVWKGAQS
jgi:hypothetical protein